MPEIPVVSLGTSEALGFSLFCFVLFILGSQKEHNSQSVAGSPYFWVFLSLFVHQPLHPLLSLDLCLCFSKLRNPTSQKCLNINTFHSKEVFVAKTVSFQILSCVFPGPSKTFPLTQWSTGEAKQTLVETKNE